MISCGRAWITCPPHLLFHTKWLQNIVVVDVGSWSWTSTLSIESNSVPFVSLKKPRLLARSGDRNNSTSPAEVLDCTGVFGDPTNPTIMVNVHQLLIAEDKLGLHRKFDREGAG
jgi:hypothetical protein